MTVSIPDDKQAHRLETGEVLATCNYNMRDNTENLSSLELDKIYFYCVYTNVGDNYPENNVEEIQVSTPD